MNLIGLCCLSLIFVTTIANDQKQFFIDLTDPFYTKLIEEVTKQTEIGEQQVIEQWHPRMTFDVYQRRQQQTMQTDQKQLRRQNPIGFSFIQLGMNELDAQNAYADQKLVCKCQFLPASIKAARSQPDRSSSQHHSQDQSEYILFQQPIGMKNLSTSQSSLTNSQKQEEILESQQHQPTISDEDNMFLLQAMDFQSQNSPQQSGGGGSSGTQQQSHQSHTGNSMSLIQLPTTSTKQAMNKDDDAILNQINNLNTQQANASSQVLSNGLILSLQDQIKLLQNQQQTQQQQQQQALLLLLQQQQQQQILEAQKQKEEQDKQLQIYQQQQLLQLIGNNNNNNILTTSSTSSYDDQKNAVIQGVLQQQKTILNLLQTLLVSNNNNALNPVLQSQNQQVPLSSGLTQAQIIALLNMQQEKEEKEKQQKAAAAQQQLFLQQLLQKQQQQQLLNSQPQQQLINQLLILQNQQQQQPVISNAQLSSLSQEQINSLLANLSSSNSGINTNNQIPLQLLQVLK